MLQNTPKMVIIFILIFLGSCMARVTSQDLAVSQKLREDLNRDGYEDFLLPESKLSKHYQKKRDTHVYSTYRESN